MANFIDYLRWRGDITLQERPFNEVDNLILSELAYFHFEQTLSEGECCTVEEIYQRYLHLEEPARYWSTDPVPLLCECAKSARFSKVMVTDFVESVDPEQEIQFSAVTFLLTVGGVYVAYRGTDSSIVGWREDFNFSYMEESPAQREALDYLNRAMERYDGSVVVGGHSKGGNLAVYAAAFCEERFGERIRRVYSNDGPGFNQFVAQSSQYLALLPKVRLMIPEDSLISLFFANEGEKVVIRSTVESGVGQHSPYTWMVERDRFDRAAKQTNRSVLMDLTVDKWIDSLEIEQRKEFVSTVFDVMEASGATTLEELNNNKWISYNAIFKAASALSGEKKQNLRKTLMALADVGRDVWWDDAKKRFAPLRRKKAAEAEA